MIFLVGHSCGSVCITQWLAERYTQKSGVVGAMVVAPADVEHAENLPDIAVQAPLALTQLPVPVHVVASTTDPYCSVERSQQCADSWGATIEFIENGGHLASSDGTSYWGHLTDILRANSGRSLSMLS